MRADLTPSLWHKNFSFTKLIGYPFMPFSQSSQLSTIVQFIEGLNPLSILDVGTGMGQYGFLARNNLEQENLFCVNEQQGWQRPKKEWRVRIDGIEGCSGYMTPVHEYVYNRILVGNALDVLPTIDGRSYELVLAVDILEHLHKADGLAFLAELKRVASRTVLVSTPKEFHPQEVQANPLENHRSHWSQRDLAEQGFSEILQNAESWIVAHGV